MEWSTGSTCRRRAHAASSESLTTSDSGNATTYESLMAGGARTGRGPARRTDLGGQEVGANPQGGRAAVAVAQPTGGVRQSTPLVSIPVAA
jgi:hypothetical protein